jgi:predicted dehydrogenase
VAETDNDLAALMDRVRPDIVSICTPVSAHKAIFDQVKAFCPGGILMEKPFALCMDDAHAMTREAAENGIKLAVNHMRRLEPAYKRVRKLLDEKVIGEIQVIATSVNGWDQMEWGIHWLDMIRFFKHDMPVSWVFGQVQCSGKSSFREMRGRKVDYGHIREEHSVNYLCFEDGTRALLDAGQKFVGDATFHVLGTAGALYLHSPNRITVVNAEGTRNIECTEKKAGPPEGGSPLMYGAVDSMVAWVGGGPASPLAANNTLLSTELCLAAYESAVHRKRIDLPMGAQPEFPLNVFMED